MAERTVRDWMHSKRPEGKSMLNSVFAMEYVGCLQRMEDTDGFRASEKYRIMTVLTDLQKYKVEDRWQQAFVDDIEEIRERIDRLKLIKQSPHRHIT